MRVIRSWPEHIPPHRAHVVDDLERFICKPDYNYAGLKDYDDDLILLEWDIAIGNEDLAEFIRAAEANPDWPRVAPYLLGGDWVHWRLTPPFGPNASARRVYRGETDCDLFGFGCIYFPRWVLRECPAEYGASRILTDGTLPRWLHEQRGWHPVPIDWSITVVHLH